MKVFVTGGTGFLGGRVIARLKKEGHEITALARGESGVRTLKEAGATTVSGTFTNISEWEKSLHGMDAIVHCAAPVVFWGKWSDFKRDMVQATVDLHAAGDRQGVKRFIHISSESVLQDKGPLLDIDETHPYPTEPNSIYGRAKKETEIALLAQDSSSIRIILRPTFIWGRGEKALDSMIAKIRSGEFMWIDQGRETIEMVHVENVVEAIVLALSKGSDKDIYFVTDDNPMPAREFFTRLFATRGVEAPTKNIGGGLARLGAGIVEGIWKLFGIRNPPPLSRFEVAFVSQPRRYNIARIKNGLGYKPVVDFKTGLETLVSG
ncbi:MAG: NAD(P)-dependent oxidoreductase [Spirochaetia bacterium]|nr:NAD(P)-dependent oxidoreductase [Spirochaetia bacterium]